MNGAETQNKALYMGDSMRGVFATGETVSLAETTFETLRVGDVVAIFGRTPYYVHRIVEKKADYAVTMGDNNDRPDALKLTRDSRFKIVTEVRGVKRRRATDRFPAVRSEWNSSGVSSGNGSCGVLPDGWSSVQVAEKPADSREYGNKIPRRDGAVELRRDSGGGSERRRKNEVSALVETPVFPRFRG